ncbi:PAS domain S-box protein [Aquabacterium sp. A7-Y]|uniref:sensor histidine kinase n=1 Tax=Aquabacterium sp. A7-Y TaxID=1349605 RepID=UPI00223DDBE5|nr:PAS domain S-box protein [Aquabacterium sp. A7-Y]MCW7537398.1 PAS domain S-box protein [Aquabacterium sp. A7-Y]
MEPSKSLGAHAAPAVSHPRRWRAYARVCSAATALLCLAALIVRSVGWPPADAAPQGLVSMRPGAAIGLGLLAVALFGLATAAPGRSPRHVPWLAGLAMLVAGLTLLPHASGLDLDLGFAPWNPTPGDGARPEPLLRMPLLGAFTILALAVSLAATHACRGRRRSLLCHVALGGALLGIGVGYVASIGLLYETDWQGSVWSDFGSVSLPSATAMLMLGTACIAVQPPRADLLQRLAADSAGGRFFRAVLPVALLFPALTGWFRVVGQRSGWLGFELGLIWMVLASTLMFVGVALLSARWIARLEAALRASQATLEQRVVERTAQLAEAIERVRESEERFRFMAEAAPALIWMSDVDGHCNYVNRSWLQFTGRRMEQETGEGWLQSVHPLDRERVAQGFRQALQSRRTFKQEYRLRRSDGAWRWIVATGTPRFEGPGRFAGYVGTGADIHDAKSTALALQASRQQLASIVDSVTAAIISLDASHRIVLFNAAAEKMFQISADRMLSRTVDLLLPERLRGGPEEAVALFEQSAAGQHEGGAGPELRGLRSGGEEFPLEASVSRVESDGVRLLTLVLRDMSEVHALEAERRARAAAEEASRAKSLFLSHLSHELRTPLNAVIGFSQLLLATAPPQDPRSTQHKYAGYILQAGNHLLAMINDLLDLSRIEAGQTQLQMRAVDLEASLQHSVQLVASQAETAGITVQVTPPPPDATPLVIADEGRLRQVLVNLLSNAIKYNRPQGHVEVGVSQYDDEDLAIEVRDTGFGMSPEQLDDLFKPFSRLGREHSDIEGTGIGLSLSKKLIEMMGGRIEVRSTPEQGSTFTAVLRAAGRQGPGATQRH